MKEYDWLQPTLERISDLLKMPDIHNSYGTTAVGPSCAWQALKIVGLVATEMLPSPTISPTKEGGLCFSWVGMDTACSMSVFPDGNVLVVARNGSSGEFSCPQQDLEATLKKISRELFPEVQAS